MYCRGLRERVKKSRVLYVHMIKKSVLCDKEECVYVRRVFLWLRRMRDYEEYVYVSKKSVFVIKKNAWLRRVCLCKRSVFVIKKCFFMWVRRVRCD